VTRIGVLGGSFNPVHVGHVMLASYLAQYADLDQVWLMLSPRNPLKEAEGLADDNHRLAMLQVAAGDCNHIKVCDIELSMPRPSYTINTLDRLKNDYPDKQFSLIIGSDNWQIFDRWRDSDRIIADYGVIVYPRPGYDVVIDGIDGVRFVDAPVVNLSSTFIREGIALGNDMDAFLPKGVNDYIKKHNLYKTQ
jgi:nicotinate-nucleotide adenylyltransferase